MLSLNPMFSILNLKDISNFMPKVYIGKKQVNVALIRYLELPHDRCYKCEGTYDGLIDA